MPRLLLAIALMYLALSGPVHAFSGAGREAWNEALKYLGGGRVTADEAEAIRQLSPEERSSKAIELLLEAERQAATQQETDQVAKVLGRTYNDLALQQASAKDFRNAAYAMAEAIKRLPDDPVLHWNLGNFHFSAGDYWEAAQSLSKAKEKGEPAMRLKAGQALVQAYMKQAQSNDPNAYDYAIRELESMTYDHPGDAELLYLLGENHRLKGDGAQALVVWDRARGMGPMPEGWDERYQQLKSAQTIKKDNQFARDASLHFKIEFEDKAKGADLARKFLDTFENAHDELGVKFGLRVDHTVHVTVYTGAQFDSAVRIPWAGGVHSENQVDLRVGPASSEAEYKNTIFHEYTHHLVSCKASQKHVPTWLNEGLAMLSEPTLDTRSHLALLDAVIRKKRAYLPFSSLSMGFTNLPSETHVRLAYAQGLSLTTAMVDRFGFDTVMNILKVLGTGQEFEETFRNVTRVSFADFEKQWFESRLQALEEARPQRPPGPGFDGLEGGRR